MHTSGSHQDAVVVLQLLATNCSDIFSSPISTSVTSISNTTSFLVMKGLSTPNYKTIKFLILNEGPIPTLLMSLETIPVCYLKIGFKKLKILMFTSIGEIKVNST